MAVITILTDWLIGWWMDCWIGWLMDWLIDWFECWLMNSMTRIAHGGCGSIGDQSAEAGSWSGQRRPAIGWSSHTVSGRRQSSLVCYERYNYVCMTMSERCDGGGGKDCYYWYFSWAACFKSVSYLCNVQFTLKRSIVGTEILPDQGERVGIQGSHYMILHWHRQTDSPLREKGELLPNATQSSPEWLCTWGNRGTSTEW